MSETLGTTGWTYSQYMGGHGLDGTTDSRPSPSVSSMGTRASTRLRKPTVKALEAMESQQQTKPRRTRKDGPAALAPAPTVDSSTGASSSGPDPALISSSAPAAAPKRFPKITFKNVLKPASKATFGNASGSGSTTTPESAPKTGLKTHPKSTTDAARVKTGRGKKGKKALKTSLQRIQITVGRAGQKLYALATVALGTDFVVPSDPEQVVQDARRRLDDDDAAEEEDDDDVKSIPPDTNPERKVMTTYKLSAPPHVAQDSWAHTGRVNDHGEEVVIAPPGYSLDRAPMTYGDEALPFPPVQTRMDEQAINNIALGYPPLLGDRNVPFDVQSHFSVEDVSEEEAQVQARKKKAAVPAEPTQQKGGRKRRLPGAGAEPASLSAPTADEKSERAQKRRRRGETEVSEPASTKQAASQTSAPRLAKAKPKTEVLSPSPVVREPPARKVQRLRITVKPPTAAEMQEEGGEVSGEEEDLPARPAANQRRQRAESTATKGKKRAAALIGEDEVTERSTLPFAKRQRAADSQVVTAVAAAPQDRGHAKAPSGSRGRGQGRGGGRARGSSSSRGKGRGGNRGR